MEIDKGALRRLLEAPAKPAVTLYVPFHKGGSPPHITENQIRLKNLVHQAVDQLRSHNDGQKVARALTRKLAELQGNLHFWEEQAPGILICAGPEVVEVFHIPLETEEYMAVDTMYHLAPILGIVNGAQDFYVLALAKHNPRLFRGSLLEGLEPLDVGLPASVAQGLSLDEASQKKENQGSATGPSTNTDWFNGRGGERDPQEEDRIRFFRMIDTAITSHLDRSLPLILAGIATETAEYRQISKYPHILPEALTGNYVGMQPGKIFDKAVSIVEQGLVEPARRAAVEEFKHLSGSHPERVSTDEQHILQAANEGRVATLLLATRSQTSDTVQDTMHEVLRLTFPKPPKGQKLNNLAIKVWGMKGRVVDMIPSEMPYPHAHALAILRY